MLSRISTVFGIAFGLLFALGCGTSTSDGVPAIRSQGEYQQTLADAQKLSQTHIEAFRNGEELDPRAIAELKQARKLFQAMLEFNSNNVAPVFGAGEIDNALGDYESAARNYRQAINLMPDNPSDLVISIVAEAHNQLANILITQTKYHEADVEASAAVQLNPTHAPFLVTLAASKVQEGETADAKRLCMEALKIDSSNAHALGILRMLQLSETEKSSKKPAH